MSGKKMLVVQLKNKSLFLAKLLISFGLIGYLLWVIDWEQAAAVIAQSDKFLIGISPAFWLLSLVFSAWRWRLVLADSQVNYSPWQAYRGYLLGTFYGIFLPGIVGGDAVRVGICVKQTHCKIGTATASVLLERIFGVFALVSFMVTVALFFPAVLAAIGVTIQSPWSLTLSIAVLLGLAIIVLISYRKWGKTLPQDGHGRIWGFIVASIQAATALHQRTLAMMFLLSVLFQTVRILGMFLLAQAIGLELPLVVFFVIVPLVYLATFLPISLGGLGVREGMFALLLSQFGVGISDAVMLSFLVYLNQMFVGVVGGAVQLSETVSRRKANNITDGAVMPLKDRN